ncbi:hypothetical protein [Erythrobacter crassostreae]|uniref:Uncharacterized protein n=1 Tax=Erythrobacter crassostreae TaxID=2828328 RepID=A0A9X1JPL1_9SPHN|nr:hypothetical protein [Erythrobacter crassostrea]MBV7259537.1 hypothetical protein [Erythrobacter crassostrea]
MTQSADNNSDSNWPLVPIVIWYCLLLLGSGSLFLLGLAFGSEAYRNSPIPLVELAFIAGPLVVSGGFFAATLYFWNTAKRQFAYGITAASVVVVLGSFAVAGGLGI